MTAEASGEATAYSRPAPEPPLSIFLVLGVGLLALAWTPLALEGLLDTDEHTAIAFVAAIVAYGALAWGLYRMRIWAFVATAAWFGAAGVAAVVLGNAALAAAFGIAIGSLGAIGRGFRIQPA